MLFIGLYKHINTQICARGYWKNLDPTKYGINFFNKCLLIFVCVTCFKETSEKFWSVWFGLVWFLCLMVYQPSWVYLMPNLFLLNNIRATISSIAGYIRHYILPKGTNTKVNVIVWLEFELAYYDVEVKHVSHKPRRPHLCFHLYT